MAEGAKQICVGLLAHVDAGKTTLSEAMLYLSGRLKKLGRVDHRDSFLDTHSLERQRGITIFSKQAVFPLGDKTVTLLDTPGHVDFSAEMERALGVMDCAVLVISGTDGVQAHTETLWRLLERRRLPCLIFVTKMDLARQDKRQLMEELKTRLDPRCADFTLRGEALQEELAMTGEKLMDEILSGSIPDRKRLSGALGTRELFPVFFGSGLKLDGVEALLEALHDLVEPPEDRGAFSARVFKIARDPQGNRLSFLRVLSGELKVRSPLRYEDEAGQQLEEKITQLRIYSGAKYETAETLSAGQLGAVLGLSGTWPGQGLGEASDSGRPALEPVMSYRLLLPYGADPAQWMPRLRVLGEEDPQLHLRWNERLRQIELRLMGRVQAEVFQSLVKERFDLDVGLSEGRVLYRETIADTVEGVGHFEPLRHYAEVHLILEPLPRGSGVVADSVCPEDSLDRNWQRLILGHILEKHHLGVLTGSPVTDVKITLASGRAHLKHTEGGDFRQATYRAIRQGLMKAESVLLEPWYCFTLEVPPDQIGRAISDVRAMNGVFEAPEEDGELVRLRGSAPVAAMNAYGDELQSYTHGRGRLSLRPEGYRPVKEQEKLVSSFGYDPTADLENTPDSVFCAHGAGFNVRWDQVEQYMHLDSALRPRTEEPAAAPRRSLSIDERELEAIMEREFGPIRRPQYRAGERNEAPVSITIRERKQYVIVDGYNVIFASEELKRLASEKLELARGRLVDLLSSYAGFTKSQLVLVFDGFRTPGNPGSRTEYHNIHVAFTPDGESADAYIERLVDEIGKNYDVRVITSDSLIRLSALRSGVLRTSSGEFLAELEWTLEQIGEVLKKSNQGAHLTKLRDGTKRIDPAGGGSEPPLPKKQ